MTQPHSQTLVRQSADRRRAQPRPDFYGTPVRVVPGRDYPRYPFYYSNAWRYRYDPWYFGGPYGFYPPYTYGLYGFAPYGYAYSHTYAAPSYTQRDRSERLDEPPTGSIRLRAEPNDARVFVDGAFAGTVDDFDGLSDHLKVEAGPHELELRADGYEPYRVQINVSEGKTVTHRARLERQ
jgi:hypothetical protein